MHPFRLNRVAKSFDYLMFSEFLKLKKTPWQSFGFRAILYLKRFKKYWLPLLFWVGVIIAGFLPFNVQPLGGRKVTNVCLVYEFGLVPFINFITRLVFYVFPKKTWVPIRLPCTQTQNIIIFDFISGRIDAKYFWKYFLKFFMKKYRVSLDSNCVWRVFVFNHVNDLFDSKNMHALKFLTAFRLPLFQKLELN